ncbi:NgoMIV family type II restriction endonuclease [Dermabacteraceae bacterium TAE3-ERU5]|nr:NgoMIV family type II restriction endonuclease [Dermabacteraceae bacterium TAE3-ERU5]
MTAELTRQRLLLHADLISEGVISIDEYGIASMADRSQASSRSISKHIANKLGAQPGSNKLKGQTLGQKFESSVADFLSKTMPLLESIRPGSWRVECVGGSRSVDHLAQYEPYRHLDNLALAIKKDRMLQAAVGNLYSVSPDILILRSPESDEKINCNLPVVDNLSANLSTMRAKNYKTPVDLVHAVVSCKFTMRSDRAQNSRSEALSVIRNRKGRAPHIVVVTAEPSPSRLASLALGTGDIDTLYHIALPELLDAVDLLKNDEAKEMTKVLVEGQRIRDIADLPLDLCV